ncbi:MAG: HAD-IA family hydrolase [Bacteroidetes bacterium]|nr:HAD-IA family hydrolase [Bacteroidota bacterium]
MHTIPFLLFDLDGTLIDSMGDIHTSANLLLAEYSCPPLESDILRPCIGQGVRYLVSCLLASAGIQGCDIEAAVTRYRRIYQEHAMDTTAPYPGVPETLDALGHCSMAVVSNKPEAASREILGMLGLSHHFDYIAGGDSYEEMKPSPLPLLRLMERRGAGTDHTFMIGDSTYDIEAGRRAGVKTVAVAYGFQPLETLKALEPDFTVSAFSELPVILD